MARHPTEVKEAGVDVEALRLPSGARRIPPTALFDAFIERVRS